MQLQNLSEIVGNIGLPGAILVYLIWRFDKFLTFLCLKLEIYNKEFTDIAFTLRDVCEELKGVKDILGPKGKN